MPAIVVANARKHSAVALQLFTSTDLALTHPLFQRGIDVRFIDGAADEIDCRFTSHKCLCDKERRFSVKPCPMEAIKFEGCIDRMFIKLFIDEEYPCIKTIVLGL